MKKYFALAIAAVFTLGACSSAGKKTAIGAGAGAAAGAVIGGIIGHQSGDAKKGALIGAAAGAMVGGAIGHKLDKQAKELEKVAETKRTEEGIVTKLKGDILFDSGKAELKPAAVSNIQQLSDILKKYPENRIVVVGHTDNTGKKETNQALSQQRANSVMLKMVERGVPQNAISVVGMGDGQPVADNKTNDGRQQNRRVELKITMVEQQQ